MLKCTVCYPNIIRSANEFPTVCRKCYTIGRSRDAFLTQFECILLSIRRRVSIVQHSCVLRVHFLIKIHIIVQPSCIVRCHCVTFVQASYLFRLLISYLPNSGVTSGVIKNTAIVCPSGLNIGTADACIMDQYSSKSLIQSNLFFV